MSDLSLQAKDALNCSMLWFQLTAGCTMLIPLLHVMHKGHGHLADHVVTCWCCPSHITKYVFQTGITANIMSADSSVHVMQQ